MSKKTIDTGSAPNDGTGDSLRVAFGKINDNFTEVYQYEATADPTATDDSDSSFRRGHWWLRTDSGELFICTDNSVGAAVWKQVTLTTVT